MLLAMATPQTDWRGTVRSAGAPVAGICVSNGRDVCRTDGAGRYTLPWDPDARFLWVRVPRGYRCTQWYAPTAERVSDEEVDFTLDPAPERAGDTFEIVHVTDIHVSVDHDDCAERRGDGVVVTKKSTGKAGRTALTRWEDLAADLAWVAAEEPAALAYVMTGDLTNNGILAEHEAVARAIEQAPLPAFCIPGNHDYMDEQALERNYERVLGPRYYSFDIGAVHFVALDWWELDRYPEAATRQRAWLANDFAELHATTPVVILSHDQLTDAFMAEWRAHRIIATFSGHRHATRVYFDGETQHFNGPTFMFGAYDHSPRSYRVARFNGDHVDIVTKAVRSGPASAHLSFAAIVAPRIDSPPEAPVVSANGGWAQFHGDAGRTGVAPQPIAPPLSRAWTAHLGEALNLGGAVAAGGAVFIGLQRENAPGGAVVALDAATGAERWRVPVAHSVKRSPAVADGLVVAATVSGEVIAVGVDSGEVVWRYQLGDPSRCWIYTAPVVHDGAVFLGEAFHFAAVELRTGRPRWVRTDFGDMAEFINMSSPAAMDDRVFVSFFWQEQNFAALDTTTGETLWTHRDGNRRAAMCGAAATAGRVFVTRVNSRLACIDAADGRVQWEARVGAIFSQATPCIAGDTVYAVGGLGRVQALDIDTGDTRWEWQAPRDALGETAPYMRATPNTIAPPVLAGQHLYVPSNCGRLSALDVESGREVWAHEFGVPLPGAPAASGNTLFVPAADGSLTAMVGA